MSRGAFTNAQRQAIYNREDQSCAFCGRHAQGGSIQHRVARGMGGTRRAPTLADGVLLDGSGTTGCHGYFEAHPEEALWYGYRVPQGKDATSVPLYVHSIGWVTLTLDGGYRPAEGPLDPLAGAA